MKNKRRKRLSQYLDELGNSDIRKIDGFHLPWQRNFLNRFYEQVRKQQLRKADISHNVNNNTDIYKLLPDDYILPENTLTQFTNFNSVDLRTISVSNLIAISNSLGVSINYLLGIDSCESQENTDINRATGLNNETIETIKNNTRLQEKLNFFLLSPKINKILTEIDRAFYMQLVSTDFLNAYSKPLQIKLESAYMKFNLEIFPLDNDIEKYIEYLYKEIPFESIKQNNNNQNEMINYLKSNLSSDLVDQLMEEANAKSVSGEKNIYTIFINDTARRTYKIFEHNNNREVSMGRITQSFLSLLNDYFFARQKAMKSALKTRVDTHE